VIVIGDDQGEAFERSSEPAIAVFWGERWRTMVLDQNAPGREPGEFYELAAKGYAMDEVYEFAGHEALGLDLVRSLVDDGFDITSVATVPAGRGFGHAFGFVTRRILRGQPIPVIPIFLNTYYPPNQPTPARCYEFGQGLERAITRSGVNANVMLIASGGLSHFVVDEELDQRILNAIASSDAAVLRSIPAERLQAGSSEIRNWIAVAGAMAGRALTYSEYVPCYRTAAGTGCAMGFVQWE
jgi:aromatic ring-opening dioxygenase catalytic subunit (LigB family)